MLQFKTTINPTYLIPECCDVLLVLSVPGSPGLLLVRLKHLPLLPEMLIENKSQIIFRFTLSSGPPIFSALIATCIMSPLPPV